jgi:hypothetical protein
MKRIYFIYVTFFLGSVQAQDRAGGTLKPEKAKAIVDTEISAMVNEVSADSIHAYVLKMVSFGTRHSLSDTLGNTRGIGAARRWVANKFKQFARQHRANMAIELDPFEVGAGNQSQRVPYRIVMKNVLGTLKGNDPNDTRIILVSGHLDSRNSNVMDSVGQAPGANDDASGVAVVLELARVLSKKKYPCTIVFMAVQGEEQGLFGARHMASKLRNQGGNVVAMLNNDIVGNTLASETGDKNENTVRIFSEMIPAVETDEEKRIRAALRSENDSPSRQLARFIKESSEVYLGKFTATLNARPDRFLRGGDHTPFSQEGYPAVRFTEFNEDFTHQHQDVRKEKNIQYGDLPEFVDYKYVANVARMNLAAIASLAKAPVAPAKVEMKVNLGNVTHLKWNAPSSGPKPKGYYIVMRETFQPFWEKKFFVTHTSAAVPFSKDNYFFGVQSVGQDDHVSPVAMPAPVRE